MTANTFNQPTEVDDVTLAFPAGIRHLMPAFEDIPDEFTGMRGLWVEWQQKWFFEGLGAEDMPVPKEGIDASKALRHLKAIQGSFEPKHEHKQAAVAYLASLWFEGTRKSLGEPA